MSVSAPPLFEPAGPESWWQTQHPSPGYEPLASDTTCDVCVIGAGISGCSTAFHLAGAGTGADVVLVDAREVAGGASGRNGGFLLAGLDVRYADLRTRLGKVRAAALYGMTVDGRDLLLRTADELGLGRFARRTGSLRLAVDEPEIADLALEAVALRGDEFDVRELSPDQLDAPLAAAGFTAGLSFAGDGASIPAAWVRGLCAAARERGVRVHEHSPAVSVTTTATKPVVQLASGQRIAAEKVVVCTEAWLPGLLPELTDIVVPYRSQLLAAAAPPGNAVLLKCPTWSRRGWDYAQQLTTGELIVGGEEREDASLYRTRAEQTDPRDQAALDAWITRVLGCTPEVLQRWAGVLSHTPDGMPLVGRIPGRSGVFVCGGWGGAGNVLGFVGGRLIAGLLAGGEGPPAEFDPKRLLQ